MFAVRFHEVRKKSGDTQAQAGERFDVTQRAIANWESGAREPDIQMIKKIALEYDVSVDYLFGLTDIPRSYNVGEAIVLTNVPMSEAEQNKTVQEARNTVGNMTEEELDKRIGELIVEKLKGLLSE